MIPEALKENLPEVERALLQALEMFRNGQGGALTSNGFLSFDDLDDATSAKVEEAFEKQLAEVRKAMGVVEEEEEEIMAFFIPINAGFTPDFQI